MSGQSTRMIYTCHRCKKQFPWEEIGGPFGFEGLYLCDPCWVEEGEPEHMADEPPSVDFQSGRHVHTSHCNCPEP